MREDRETPKPTIHTVASGGGRQSGARFGCTVDGGPLRHRVSKIPGTNQTFWCTKCADVEPGTRLERTMLRIDRRAA